jgi:hypothetical protein
MLSDALKCQLTHVTQVTPPTHTDAPPPTLALQQVMLLAEGRMMYYGAAGAAAAWFGHLGYAMPYGAAAVEAVQAHARTALLLASAHQRAEHVGWGGWGGIVLLAHTLSLPTPDFSRPPAHLQA